MNYKRALCYGVLGTIIGLGFLDSMYQTLDKNMPLDKTLIENDSVKVEKKYNPKVVCGIPVNKVDSSYTAIISYKVLDTSNTIHEFDFYSNFSSLSPEDVLKIKGMDSKSDKYYSFFKSSLDPKLTSKLEETLLALNKSQN